MDIKNNEVSVSRFETETLPKILTEARLSIEALNSLEGGVKGAFVSGVEKLYQIDEGGKKIKPVDLNWLPGATHTLFETANSPDEELRIEKARQTHDRAENYIKEVGRGFSVDPTNELKGLLFELQDKELPFLVTRK